MHFVFVYKMQSIFSLEAEWAISVMTFSGVINLNGVGTGGTLYKECMGRVVFHHEQLYAK